MAQSESQATDNTIVKPTSTPTIEADIPPKSPWTRISALWESIELDGLTALTMFKGALPPTIGIAIYESDAISRHFGTTYDTIPVISILCLCTMPRAKFLENLILNIICLAIGCCMAFLGLYASIQAREHTETARAADGYNSSASVVSALFLILNIYAINAMRAKFPSLQFPAINYGIFINVVFTYTPLAPGWTQGIKFIGRLTEAFLIGFALASAVSLFISPLSVRTIVFKEQFALLAALQKSVCAPAAATNLVEKASMFGRAGTTGTHDLQEQIQGPNEPIQSEILILEKQAALLSEILGKIRADMIPAKREWAWGKIGALEMDKVYGHFRTILIPVISISTIGGSLNAVTDRQQETLTTARSAAADRDRELWLEVLDTLRNAFKVFSVSLSTGLEHVGIVLELSLRYSAMRQLESRERVIEAEKDHPDPGSADFAEYLEGRVSMFFHSRASRLKKWIAEYNNESQQIIANEQTQSHSNQGADFHLCRQRLYVILYLDHLMHCTGVAILNFVRYADSICISASLSRNRLILPISKSSTEAYPKTNSTSDPTLDDSNEIGSQVLPINHTIQRHNRDIEHLEPTNRWQKCGNTIRTVSKFLRSPESLFGFRVACATLTVGIVAFLHQSQVFFREQRLVWAMITIAIGMGWTTGQSVYTLLARVAGTILATVLSLVIFYVVDGHAAGIIVLLFLATFAEFYFIIKKPQMVVVVLICMTTQVSILTLDLAIRKVGVKPFEIAGIPYHPIYILAPYRLLCVTGGSIVAFIWTIIPFPITERSQLRRDLGASTYLLARYYNCVQSLIRARFQGTEGDPETPQSPGQILASNELKMFAEEALLLGQLRAHSTLSVWDVTIGGKFPQGKFDEIIQDTQNLLHHFASLAYAARTIPAKNDNDSPWLGNLRRLLKEIAPTSHEISSILILLSSAVTTGTALPPYLLAPKFYNISERLDAMDPGILSINNALEPGYAAYAVLQVTFTLVSVDLDKLITNVKELVGEVDFNFDSNPWTVV